MNTSLQVEGQLWQMIRLVQYQRISRMVIRALWFFGIAYFLMMCIGILASWDDKDKYALWIGLVFSLVPLVTFFTSKRSMESFLWVLDRRLGLKEQISAAWQTLKNKENNPFVDLLHQDVHVLLKNIYLNIRAKGWYLTNDGIMLVCAVILVYCVLSFSALRPELSDSYQSLPPLPPMNSEPTHEDIFPEGIISFYKNELSSTPKDDDKSVEESLLEARQLEQTLKEVGKKLSEQALTLSLGEALQKSDVEQAASIVEMLADNVNLLDKDTQQQIAQLLQEASQPFQQIGQQEIAKHLEEATNAMKGGPEKTPKIKEGLKQIANDLKAMRPTLEKAQQSPSSNEEGSPAEKGEKNQASGTGSEMADMNVSVESSEAEPVSRLSGEGKEVMLESAFPSNDDEGNISNPNTAQPNKNISKENVSYSLDVVLQGDDVIIQSVMSPYYYPWKWQDEITRYFERNKE